MLPVLFYFNMQKKRADKIGSQKTFLNDFAVYKLCGGLTPNFQILIFLVKNFINTTSFSLFINGADQAIGLTPQFKIKLR